ncbi:YezD family protein [Anaeroselena agilis]|uniref:YezD family protein n=1 Tax=Anaeroselena agilis TaxID=3063788 RepID=A0ABU3NS62_9FIRM|nr:YezD family protein [Selenomonadales bacterium 4137-cl]
MDARKNGAGSSDFQALRTEISKALGGLQYGQVVILIKDGKVTQIDRTEKRRLPSLQGINGEGI